MQVPAGFLDWGKTLKSNECSLISQLRRDIREKKLFIVNILKNMEYIFCNCHDFNWAFLTFLSVHFKAYLAVFYIKGNFLVAILSVHNLGQCKYSVEANFFSPIQQDWSSYQKNVNNGETVQQSKRKIKRLAQCLHQ